MGWLSLVPRFNYTLLYAYKDSSGIKNTTPRAKQSSLILHTTLEPATLSTRKLSNISMSAETVFTKWLMFISRGASTLETTVRRLQAEIVHDENILIKWLSSIFNGPTLGTTIRRFYTELLRKPYDQFLVSVILTLFTLYVAVFVLEKLIHLPVRGVRRAFEEFAAWPDSIHSILAISIVTFAVIYLKP
jgi:hypothetical protein